MNAGIRRAVTVLSACLLAGACDKSGTGPGGLDITVPSGLETGNRSFTVSPVNLSSTVSPFGGLPMAIALVPHTDQVLVGDRSGNIRHYDSHSGEVLLIAAAHGGEVRDIAVSPDGEHFVSAGRDGKARIWNLSTGEIVHELLDVKGRLNSVAYSPDGEIVAVGGGYNWETANLYRTSDGTHLRVLAGEQSSVRDLEFSSDGRVLISAMGQRVHVWNVYDGSLRWSYGGSGEGCRSVVVNENGSLIGAAFDDSLVVLDSTGAVLYAVPGKYMNLSISSDGLQLYTSAYKHHVDVRDFRNGDLIREIDWSGPIRGVETTLSGDEIVAIVAASEDGVVRYWDASDGTLLRTLGTGQPSSLAVTPDGETVVTGHSSGQIALWDATDSGTMHLQPEGHTSSIMSVEVSSDGKYVATGGSNGDPTVRVWSIEGQSLRLMHVLEGHTEAVRDLAFVSEGRYIASLGNELSMRLWDVQTGTHIASIDGIANHYSLIRADPVGDLVSVGGNGSSRLYRIIGSELREIGIVPGIAIRFNDDDEVLIHHEHRVSLWRAGATEPIASQALDETSSGTYYSDMVVTPDGRTIIAVGSIQPIFTADQRVARGAERAIGWYMDFYGLSDGTLVQSKNCDDSVDLVAMSANGLTLATLGYTSLWHNSRLQISQIVVSD
jgi:WD40 repeat protein